MTTNIEFFSFVMGMLLTLFCLFVFRDALLRRLLSGLFIKSNKEDIPVNEVLDKNKLLKQINSMEDSYNKLVDDFNELQEKQEEFTKLIGLIYTICEDYINAEDTEKLIEFMKSSNVSKEYFNGCKDFALFFKQLISKELDIEFEKTE